MSRRPPETFEVQVNFRNLSLVDLNTNPNEAKNFSDQLIHEDHRNCFLRTEDRTLIFLDKKDDTKGFASMKCAPLNPELSRTSQKLFLFRNDSKYAMVEIKANINILEKINKFIETFSNLSKERGPLSYNPSNSIRESPFSSGSTETNLRGFLHLALIALVVAKAGDIFSNLANGNYTLGKIPTTITLPQVGAMLFMQYFPFVTQWLIDYMAYKGVIDRSVVFFYILNFGFLTIGPNVVKYSMNIDPVAGIVYFTYIFSNCMKMISYAHTNYHIRKLAKKAFEAQQKDQDITKVVGLDQLSNDNWEIIKKNKSDLSKICTLKGALYFGLAPTICYQLTFPKLKKFRPYQLFKLVMQLMLWIALMSYVGTDYLEPILQKCPEIVKEGNVMKIIEAYIHLSIPSTILWILFFFLVFHFLLNIHGEITCYGDREFYKEWWNCRDLNEYWRCWNIPAHYFFTRHIYYPCIRKKIHKNVAVMIVFLVSALLHEFWISSALGFVTGVTTLVFVVQAPVMVMQKKLDKFMRGSQLGNWLFWISFCFMGQPLSMMSYYLLYYHKNYQPLIKLPTMEELLNTQLGG